MVRGVGGVSIDMSNWMWGPAKRQDKPEEKEGPILYGEWR